MLGNAPAARQHRRPIRTFFGSLRTQLTLALWVPTLAAVMALTFVAVSTANESAKDRDVALVLDMSRVIQDYLDAVNMESRAAFELTSMEYSDATQRTDAALEELFVSLEASRDRLPPDLIKLADELRAEDSDRLDMLRAQVSSGVLPPAGVLGIFFNMRSMTTLVPQDYVSDISSSPMRNQLNAMAQAWMFNARLETEQVLVELWLAGNPKVTGPDIAAAIRETDVAEDAITLALGKLDGSHSLGSWSTEVAESREYFAAMNGQDIAGFAGVSMLPFGDDDARGEYLHQIGLRVIEAQGVSNELVQDAGALSESEGRASARDIAISAGLAVLVLILAIVAMLSLTRRVLNPVVSLVAATRERAQDLPRQLDTIEKGGAPQELQPIVVPTAGPELTEFAGNLNDLIGTAVDMATKEAQQRAAVVGMLRTVAHREAALVNRQLELLDKYERHEVDPVFLSRLFNLDHVTTQMRRMCDSLLVLAGAAPARRTTPPLSLVDVVRGASSQIQQYSRVDLDVWYDPRIHGHKVSDLTLLLAELLDNATKYSHPDTRVTVTFTRGTDAALVTIADEGIGFDDAALMTAQELVDSTDPDHFAMFDRLGLQTVSRLCQRTGVSVSFAGGTDLTGTRVAVRIPDALLADPGAGAGVRLATAQAEETYDDAVNRPASVTLYGQQL